MPDYRSCLSPTWLSAPGKGGLQDHPPGPGHPGKNRLRRI